MVPRKWKIWSSGYLKKGKIKLKSGKVNQEFDSDALTLGMDKIIRKNKDKNVKFDIRFHLDPGSKVMKTQDNKSILIELEDEGWKFNCENYDINIDNGLYFGNKNLYSENQNILISGILGSQTESIKWEIKKI